MSGKIIINVNSKLKKEFKKKCVVDEVTMTEVLKGFIKFFVGDKKK